MIRSGLTTLLQEKAKLIKNRSIGLITNPTGVDEELRDNVSLFAADTRFDLAALFAPEHGFWGAAQDVLSISSFVDERTKTPVYSLYGENRKPTPEMLENIDALIFDIQDVGSRFYTFISTMKLAMESAAQHGVIFIVLDRPNPINGVAVEGNILNPKFSSFVGAHPLPVRHGLTIGELALLFKSELKLDLELKVVKMQGWCRDMWYDDTGLHWILPSPNMPTLTTATLYPGTCFIEGTNISEGRGTTKPFELLGAPWMDAHQLADELNSLRLPGIKFRPVSFTPTFSKYRDELCQGIQAHLLDREIFKPVETGLMVIQKAQQLYPENFGWKRSFDLLAGGDEIRRKLSGDQACRRWRGHQRVASRWRAELSAFKEKRREYLIY